MATKSSSQRGSAYRCDECGTTAVKWVGRCPECQAWNTLREVAAGRPGKVAAGAPSTPARRIDEVDVESARARSTGVGELDRVLGGGLVPGVVVLLAGEPGVGKSTLLLEVAYQWARGSGGPTLYVTGEESAGQVRLRAERTGNVDPGMFLAAESDVSALMGHVEDIKPGLLVVDSVQTMSSPEADSAAGGVTQIKAVTAALVALAKDRGLPVILVGHVTKEGAIAGPRVLEHLVDVVLHFEGDRHSSLRMLRGVKNRYGPADEVGCFEMVDRGIVDVPDPSGLFLNRHDVGVPGTAVTVAMDGKRPMLVEVQALVANSPLNTPRRAVSGLDSARVAMILAVLERRGGVRLGDKDVFAATVGGIKVGEPVADLSVALAVATAAKDVALPPDLVVLGEVGLAGEVRRVGGVRTRLAEALRLGFTKALIPPDCGDVPDGLQVRIVRDLGSAMNNLQVLRG
ncbi:DNA repair protein RadA [Actinokineospora guangxiensis]|uniref:DNA repair protein RadA n=1 Tax=Actinokineospora guangxiensis TaxID=1490288 RepID=A0ABW0ELR6_9PSEU